MDENDTGREIVDASVAVNRELGPGNRFGAATMKEGIIRTVSGLPE